MDYSEYEESSTGRVFVYCNSIMIINSSNHSITIHRHGVLKVGRVVNDS